VKEFKQIAKMEEVDFSYKFEETQILLKCEPLHLANAINNLLDNAKKYSKENPTIELLAQIKDKKFQLWVKDNGLGIEKKHLKNIFKKHFRVPLGDLYHVKGYGLGLNYVQKIIKLHKGKIDIESDINKGTTITLKLPIAS